MQTVTRKGLGSVIPEDLHHSIANPLILKTKTVGPIHTYDYTVMIDICDAIWKAAKAEKLHPSQLFLAKQAELIIIASACLPILFHINEEFDCNCYF